ncbi:MAG: AAA family ATPase [Planctomycetota bacterium]|jgi:ATP-dependent 26S proteasome regulatory subunit
MTLARLLQPSVVVIEDVDLIARDRTLMENSCDEVLLHKLLNEMDGLRPDAEVLFILTTNRPETLEVALASRPGRIDQAIEFPLPDEEGRAKLVRLYSCGLSLPDEVIETTVRKTENVSASFIKELMRRAAQFQIERDENAAEVTVADIDNALEELLFTGGSLNRKLLGADLDRE